jgi:hypothetical protein
MFVRWARVVIRRPALLLVGGLVAMISAGAWGSAVLEQLDGGGWEDPQAESARASAFLRGSLDRADADVIALYSSPTLTVDDAEFRDQVVRVTKSLPAQHVESADSFFTTQSPAFVSTDRHQTFAVVQLKGKGDDERQAAFTEIEPLLSAEGLELHIGGNAGRRRPCSR